MQNQTLDTWAINDIIYKFPTDPTLHSILHGNDSFPTSSHVVQVKSGGLVELIMVRKGYGQREFGLLLIKLYSPLEKMVEDILSICTAFSSLSFNPVIPTLPTS
jgi:hypothetical protein